MSDGISYLVNYRVNEDALDDFRALAERMIAATEEAEPGTVGYQWFADESGLEVQIYESFADEASLLAHFANFGANFVGDFLKVGKVTGLSVYGAPDGEVKAQLDAMGARYLPQFAGFTR